MIARHVLLRSLLFLLVGSIIALTILHFQEQAYQALRLEGWKTFLQEFSTGTILGSPGAREGDIALDKNGRIWVAGGGVGLEGLHFFDGTKWISRDGGYWDLTVAPQGEVWAVSMSGRSIDVYDGQHWIDYKGSDLGLGETEILQVEVDSKGRVWVTTDDFGTAQLGEISLEQSGAHSASYKPHLTVTDGAILSLDTDNQGRVWAAMGKFGFPATGDFKFYDGNKWQRVTETNTVLKQAVRTAYDHQGRVWVATEDGTVMMYSGKEWILIAEGERNSDCLYCPQIISGLTVDNQDRVWVWNYSEVRYLEDSKWMTLSPENSGLFENEQHISIFGVVIDDRDRIWIASSGGVSMAAVQDAKPLPEKLVALHLFQKGWLPGMNWFIPSMLAILLLAAYVEILPGVLLASMIGVVLTLLLGPADPGNGFAATAYPVPGAIVTFLGILGGLIGGVIDRRGGAGKGRKWAISLALAGLLIGGAILFFLMVLISY